MAKNLLVDWMNANNTKRANFLANIQSNMANKTSATNPNTVTTPNTPTITRPAISRPATINLQKAQQPVQTRLDNLNNQTLPVTQPGTITGNNPAFVNGKLRPSSTNEVMNAAQSRFIGFQQQQPTYPNTTIGTGQEGKSFEKLYNGGYMRIESNAEKAEKYNKKEEEKFRTTSEALMDFQGDVLKNNGKMTDWQLENRYPEFSDNLDSLKELQNELRPIVQSGMGVDPEQLAEYYPELLKPKKTYSIEAIKKNAAETEKAYENAKKIMDKALTLNVEGLSSNGLKVARDYDTLFNIVDVVKKKHSLGDANNSEILGYLLKNNDKVRELWDEIEASKANLTKTDKAILNRKDASLLDRVITEGTTGIIDLAGKGLEKLGLEGNRKATDEEIETAIRAKEKLESDFANQTWKKLAVEINVPLDSLEKFAYRTYKDVQNKILEKGSEYTKEKITKTIKSAFKKELGVDLTDEQVESIRNLYDTAVTPSINQEIQTNQQNVMDYLESVNKEYQSKRGTLDEDIENYTNNRSMTKMLLNRDLSGFGYKSSGEAAQNAEMPLMILAGTVAPEIVLPLMTMDSYARESQESFEELMEVQQKNGISVQDAYENAQEGAAIVGIASAAVEVGLERLLGGVETTASKAFHDLLIKDVAEKTTKMVAERGLAEMLKQGLVTQFRSSFEEGMEEILQQAIHNKALQKYDPDQKLTEGLLQSFEGGFFNWMNLLGGGGDILSNIQQNKTNIIQNANQTAYNLGERARNVVDNLNQGAYNAGANTRNILDNVRNRVTTQNTQENQTNTLNNVMDTVTKQTNTEENQTNTSITPVNNNIQATNEVIEVKDDNTTTEKKNTAIKEGGLGEKVLESLNGLDENTRERIKKNPYSVEESKNLIKEMDENPGIDFGDYQNGRYEDVLNTILNKLEQKEDKRRNDIGSLYDKLEESNIDVDVTELKNKVAEFEAQAEALGDIITPAEQGQIKTILKNIQEIGDGTMDVWKVRRIADKRTKGSASSSYDGIGLIREIRDTIDSVIREQNPDMKEVDKAYRKVLNEISEIKGKLFYKKGGQVKSNAVSTVKNMLNAGNRLDLNNLEKYLPGIKDQLEAIRDSKFVYNAYTTGRGSRFISGIARGVFGNIGKAIGFFAGGWGGLLGGAVIDAGIDKAMVNLTRKALRDTITKETAASKAELERISKKIEEGKKLDAEDKARLKELGEKIMKNGEQMAKTKAEKEAWNKYMEEINDNITPQTTEEEQEKNKVTKKRATKKNKVTERKAETKKSDNQKKVVISDNNPEGLSLEGQPITDNITINDKNASQTKTDAKKITKDSEGNTLSAENQEKFGNSKIVDKDGNLLVVMHGSSNQETHDYYDETKAGSNVHADSKGVYFTDNLDLAEQFAHEQLPGSSAFRTVLGKRGHLYKSYVNITNPLNLNTATPEQLLPFFREDVLTKTWDEEKRLDNLKGHPQFVKFHVDMDKVEKAGYDGIIAAIGKEGEGNEYIVFKGNQAKNIGEIEAPKTEAKKEQPKNKVTSKRAKATAPKQEENQTLTKVDGKAQPTQEQRKLIRDWLEKQDLNRDHPFVPMLLNDVSTKGVRDYVYGAISQILGHSGIDFNKATDFFKSIGIDPEGWEREMEIAPTYYYKGKVVNEKKSQQSESKNIVTNNAKATEKKQETKKAESKTAEDPELREKIGDKFYEYMQKQVELTNNTRKGKNGLTGEPLNLKEVTMEELLPQYIDQFEKIAQQEVQEIQDELAEVTKDLPKAPKLTESQKTQLSKATSQEERNKLLRKWQDEWLKKNPISDEKVEQIRKLMDRAAEVVEGHKKARNYLYELEVEEENKENEDHFSYDTYGDIMKRVEDAENKINEEFDKKFEEEYDSKKKRFDELNEDDNTDRSDGSEIAKLANDLNNMRNKYDRLKEEAFNKRYPDLVEEKKRQEELFDKDWKKTYRRAIWNMENNNSKTKITDTAKNKVTNITVTKGGNITPDNSGITGRFRNLTAEEYNDMKEMGGLEKLYQQGKTDTIFRMQDLKEVVNAMIDLTVYGLPEDFNIDYHDFTTQSNGQSIVEIQQILDKLEAGEDTKEFEDVYGDHMVEKKDGTYEWDVEELKRLQRDYIGNMLDWAYERAYGEEKEVDRKLVDQIQGDLEGVKMDSYDIKKTEKMIDKMKELVKKYGEYWHQGNSNDQWNTFVRYATDIDNLDNNETAQIPTIFEEDLEQMNLRELDENETPQANEEEMNKVTKRQPEKPKNLVTSKKEDNFMEEQAKSFDTPEAFIESAISKDYKVGDNVKGLGTIQDVTDTQVKINGQRFAKKILGDNIDNVTLSTIRSTLDNLQAKNKDISDIISARKKGLYLLSFIQNSKNKQHLADIGYLEPVGDSSGAEGFTTAKSHMRDYANLKHGVENAEKQLREYWESVNNEAKVSKPKNLVTSKIEENNNTDSKAEQIFNTSMEQLKGAKKTSLGALGKVKQTEVKLDNGTTITYIDSSVGKGISQNAIIRVNSPEAGYKTYVVTKIPNNPAEIREGGNVLTDEQVDKVYDILQGKNGEVKVEDMRVDAENVEDKKDPINAFLDNNEAIKNDPKLKYKYLSRLNDQTSWIDYSTDIRYNGTVAEKVQQTIDSFGKLSNGTRLPIKFSKNNYGNYIEVGDWETGAASRNIGDDIEFEYAKFLYDNPEIRSTKEIKADGLKEAIKKGNEIHKEVVKDAEEQKDGTPLDPEKYIRQQPTADEGIEAVYNETKKISDYFEARKEQENSGRIGYTEEYRNKIKAAQEALWRKLKFKSDRSKLYQDFVKNIRESNGNEKQLRSIAKNLYIQKVKDDFKNNYNYPAEVTDKVPGLRTAKDNYERYLKGRDTSFSGKDPRIDYSDKDRIGAGIKRQDGNQVTAAQRREIVNGVLEYAKYMGIDMKKMSEDAGVTYVHLNGKHPFLTKSAVGLFHGLFKSISVGADMESYSEKGKGRDAKLETHTVPVVMAHEITHAIDSMFERSLFSDQKTREMGRKMNDGRGLGDYWWRKAEITARMVEEYVDVMKGGEGYYNMRGYWNKDVFDNEIKPYVEQIFDEKFNGYKLTAKERNDIKLDEAPKSNNSITATDLNKVTNR